MPKTAIVTGGANGLGRHLATKLHSLGVSIVIADINLGAASNFAKELNAIRPHSAFFHKLDVAKWEDQVALFRAVVGSVGRIDYVIANAGILESTFLPKTSDKPGDDFVKPDFGTVRINFQGVLYTCSLAAQVFRRQSIVDGFRGKMIINGSVASFYAIPYMPLYSATKHGIVGFVRSFGQQLESENITVNAVCPNITRSTLTGPEIFDAVQAQGRLTPNENVTNAFISFLGDSKLTGQCVTISMDNKQMIGIPYMEDDAIRGNITGLAETHKAAYATFLEMAVPEEDPVPAVAEKMRKVRV